MLRHLRIAKPVSNIDITRDMYCKGLGLSVLSSFENHEGFDGIMLGTQGMQYHFEFTVCRNHPVVPSPTLEDLIVFYEPEASAWNETCTRMMDAGFVECKSFNPYWDISGKTFVDKDGYRIVIQRDDWNTH